MFRVIVIAFVGFTVGAAAIYAVVLFGTLAIWQLLGVVDRDGGGSMGLAFVIAPLAALVGGSIAAVAAGVRANQRQQGAQVGRDDHRRDVSWFALVAGVIAGGFAGHFIASIAFWLAGPIQYDAMWKAMAHGWAPSLLMLAGAIAGGFLVRRLVHS